MGRGRGVERDRGGGVVGCKRFLFWFVNGMLRHDHLERVLPPHRQHRGHQQRQRELEENYSRQVGIYKC